MDFGDWLQVGGLGIGGVALILVLWGKLWPLPWVDRLLKTKDDVIAQQAVTIDKNATTMEQVLSNRDDDQAAHETILHALESIQKAADDK